MKKFKLDKHKLTSAVKKCAGRLEQKWSTKQINLIINKHYRFIDNRERDKDAEIETFYVQVYQDGNELQNEIALSVCIEMMIFGAKLEHLFDVHRLETMREIRDRFCSWLSLAKKNNDIVKFNEYCKLFIKD